MNGPRINIIHKYLPEPVIPDSPGGSGAAEVVWSQIPQTGMDIAVYYNHISDRPGTRSEAPIRLLFTAEPVVVLPEQWTTACWQRYDGVLTWNRALVKENPFFQYCPVISYGKPWPHPYGIPAEPCDPAAWDRREDAMVMIVGGKQSLVPGNLYGFRKNLALAAHRKGLRLDVYGRPPLRVPNHCGETTDKLATLRQYRYAVVTENCHHPRWSTGYLTEKLFDALYAGCVPLYLGCSNLEQEVPDAPVLPLDRNPGSLHLPSREVGQKVADQIPEALARLDAPTRFGVRQLYAAAAGFHVGSASRFPDDCLDSGTKKERLLTKAFLQFMRVYHSLRK